VYIVEINRAVANDQYLLILWVVNETSIETIKGSVTLEMVNDTDTWDPWTKVDKPRKEMLSVNVER